jgi:hypothetical protein
MTLNEYMEQMKVDGLSFDQAAEQLLAEGLPAEAFLEQLAWVYGRGQSDILIEDDEGKSRPLKTRPLDSYPV